MTLDFKEWLKLPETKAVIQMLEEDAKNYWWDTRLITDLTESIRGEVEGMIAVVRKFQELGEDE